MCVKSFYESGPDFMEKDMSLKSLDSLPKIKATLFYSCERKCRHPYYINTIEIELLWAKITYLNFQTDLSYEVLNIDFGQGAANI